MTQKEVLVAATEKPYRYQAQRPVALITHQRARRGWKLLVRARKYSWYGQLIFLFLPFGIGIVTLFLLPAVIGLPLAFTSFNSFSAPQFNGLDNFRQLWNDRVFHIAVGNTLLFIMFAVPLRLLCSVAVALAFLRRFPGVGPMRSMIVLPTVVPDVAWALAWLWILNPIYGPLNLLLGTVGIEGPAWMLDEVGARFAIILMMSWQFGEGFIVCLGALSEIPPDILDQSRVDGAARWTQFFTITLPLIFPYLAILVMRDVLFSLHANFVPAKILGLDGGPNYATTYLPTWIYTNAFGYLRIGYAAAMTWVSFFMTLALAAPILFFIVRRRGGWAA